MRPKDHEGGESALGPGARLSERSIQTLFQEVRTAQRRLASLHSRPGSSDERTVPELIQELDIAHQKLRVAEEHIRAQADALALARSALDVESRRFRELFEAAPEAYLLTDLHGNIRQANRRAASLLNADARFLIGEPLHLFVCSDAAGELSQVLSLLGSHERACTLELRMLPRESAEAFWAGISVCSASGLDGQPVALRWLIRDISSAKLTQERLAMRVATLQKELRECARELEATRYLLEHSMIAADVRADPDACAIPSRFLQPRIQHMRVALNLLGNWLQILQRENLGPQGKARGFASMGRAVASLSMALERLVGTNDRGAG